VLSDLIKIPLHLQLLCKHRVAVDFEYFKCLFVDFLADHLIITFDYLVMLGLFLAKGVQDVSALANQLFLFFHGLFNLGPPNENEGFVFQLLKISHEAIFGLFLL
jgi:hypothetical protein